MRFASQAFAKLWRRLNAIEKEIASFGIVTKETAATEREPVSKPRTVAAPPKPSYKPANKQKLRGWKSDLAIVAPRPTDAEALENF